MWGNAWLRNGVRMQCAAFDRVRKGFAKYVFKREPVVFCFVKARLSAIWLMSPGSLRTSKVSLRRVYSSTLIKMAAGRPFS